MRLDTCDEQLPWFGLWLWKGLATDEQYIAKYCERTGRDGITNWNFYLVFSLFRLAAILQGIKKRAQIGTASSAEAQSRGNMVQPLAELGVQLL